jgi:outer membrane protein TolC
MMQAMRRPGLLWIRLVSIMAVAGGCAPSRSYMFDPVAGAVRERTGVTPEWRAGDGRSAAAQARVEELLAVPLTPDSAAQIAVLANPELQAAYAELGVSQGAVTDARKPPDPHIEFEQITIPGDHTAYEVKAVVSVTGLLTMRSEIRAANAEARAARRQAVVRTVEIATAARAAFYRAAAAEQTRGLRAQIAEAAGAAAELARSLRAAGNVTELELARKTVVEEEALLALADADADVATAREAVNRTLGLTATEGSWTIAAELPDVPAEPDDVDALEAQAVAASLELDGLRWSQEAARKRAGAEFVHVALPDVGVGVAAHKEHDWGYGPAITLSLPLFLDGFGRWMAARARVDVLRHQLAAAALDVQASAREAATRLRLSRERAARIRDRLLPTRQVLLDEAVRQYNAMNVDAFELLLLRREQIAAQVMHIAALRDYWLARADVDSLRAGVRPRRAPSVPATHSSQERSDEPSH